MTEKTFVDTNILVYAHDLDANAKRKKAQNVLADLWENETGTISIQVLHEFYVTVTHKIPNPLSSITARGIIENYLAWPLVINDGWTLKHAIDIKERYQLSFWDSLILAAASQAKATILLTEDLSHNQEIEGIRILNPFH